MNDPRLASAPGLASRRQHRPCVASLRKLVADQPDFAAGHFELARALGAAGDHVAAEAAFRAAIAADPAFTPAAASLAALLTARRDMHGALAVLAPFVAGAHVSSAIWSAQGDALKRLRRLDEAAQAYRRAAEAAPNDGIAEHNLASALGEAHDFAGSEAATRRALAKGVDAPETWLARGRALMGLAEWDDAEAAFREALRRRPFYADAHGDLAELIWMRTEDAAAAGAALDAALKSNPADAPMSLAKAKLLEYVGDREGPYETILNAISRNLGNPELQVAAANLIVYRDPTKALEHAERAVSLTPGSAPAETAVCQANLAVGRADVAAAIAERLCREWPLDQFPVALAATAWANPGRSALRRTLQLRPGGARSDDWNAGRMVEPSGLPRRPRHPSARTAAAQGSPDRSVPSQRNPDRPVSCPVGRSGNQGLLHRLGCADPRLHHLLEGRGGRPRRPGHRGLSILGRLVGAVAAGRLPYQSYASHGLDLLRLSHRGATLGGRWQARLAHLRRARNTHRSPASGRAFHQASRRPSGALSLLYVARHRALHRRRAAPHHRLRRPAGLNALADTQTFLADALGALQAGAPADIARAVDVLVGASRAGDAEADRYLAALAAAGVGMPQDWERALDRLLDAAVGGSTSARGQLLALAGQTVEPGAWAEPWQVLRRAVRLEDWMAPAEKRVLNTSPNSWPFRGSCPCRCAAGSRASRRAAWRRLWSTAAAARRRKSPPGRRNSAFELPFIDCDVVVHLTRARIAATIGAPTSVLESSQILNYQVGEQFSPHHDFLDPSDPAHAADILARGQRIVTFLVYLNDAFDGGDTAFPRLDLRHRGGAGDALYFGNLDPAGGVDRRTLHAGLAPTRGEKWVFSQWIRNMARV